MSSPAASRLLGFPARYISGYLMMNDAIDQAASHAWAEAYVPGLGWVAFDASNGISPDERYVRMAVGRDYRDAMPVSESALDGRKNSLPWRSRWSSNPDSCCQNRFHDVLRRIEDRPGARVHVGHAHQRGHRSPSPPSARCMSGRSPASASSC